MVDDTVDIVVCAVDGVAIGSSAIGKIVHLDELPEDVEPHDVTDTMTESEWATKTGRDETLAVVAFEMLTHHTTMHPQSSCAFAQRLETALRSPRS